MSEPQVVEVWSCPLHGEVTQPNPVHLHDDIIEMWCPMHDMDGSCSTEVTGPRKATLHPATGEQYQELGERLMQDVAEDEACVTAFDIIARVLSSLGIEDPDQLSVEKVDSDGEGSSSVDLHERREASK